MALVAFPTLQKRAQLQKLQGISCAVLLPSLDAMKETNEWRRVTSEQQGRELIAAAESAVKAASSKLKNLGHGVTLGMPD